MDSLTPEQRMKSAASSDVAAVIEQYGSRIEGHYNEELTTSRIQYGENIVSNHNTHAVLKRLYHAFVNVFIIALAVIDILWMVLDPDIIYFVILTTLILVSGTMTFIQETRSSKAASKLVNMVTTIITVRREDVETEVDSVDLVAGDILILDTGDLIPADVRIIKSNHLKVDQSALTGESDAVLKGSDPVEVKGSILECNNMAFMGSCVTEGSAEAIVIAVGDDTVLGSMAESLSRKSPKTTYDKGSKAIVSVLLKLMVFMVPPVFIIMVLKGYFNGMDMFENILEAVIFSLTLAIGLMPEMLATIVSTNLAKGAIDMSKKKVIVKDVNAIQNFGGMDVLCSDKTGTLTENRVCVQECNDIYGMKSEDVERMVCLNSIYLTASTNQIDWAIQEHAEDEWLMEELDDYDLVGDIPFDFIRRRSTVVVKKPGDDAMMITKGAVPEILSISKTYMNESKVVTELDSTAYDKIMGWVEWYSQKGMRVLGVASKTVEDGKTKFEYADESDLIFQGFIVFTDPVKKSSKKAISDLAEYGISVKVLTGDNEFVTHYVCEQIGIKCDDTPIDVAHLDEYKPLADGKSHIITGPQISEMTDEQLKLIVETNNVFVRLTPDDKSRVVLALRSNGHCVGLMGDGINDVLAMKNADVGISVDTGTDITKETASMILLEKDLGILKDGAIEGRKVYVNSIKYVKMIGSINFGYMFSLILATLLFNFEPMGAIMILIFNLINDFACLVIPWDKVEDEFVKEPRKWDAINLKNVMFRYGPMCPITDVMSWMFMIFVIFGSMSVTQIVDASGAPVIFEHAYNTMGDVILAREDLSGTNVEALFQAIWCIEQYWMQVWAIHIVRTNKMPFFQAWSSKILVVTTIIALVVGTVLPFTGALWSGISAFPMEFFQPFFFSVAGTALIWMPFIACVYFFGSHLVKKRMLKTKGYFAC